MQASPMQIGRRKLMRAGLAGLLLVGLGSAALAQDNAPSVRYAVSFPNAVHHEAQITVRFEAVEGPLEVRMARSSPGRYAVHEFAKNVYAVSAVDGAGAAVEVSRDDPFSWTVEGHDGVVALTYTLFADRADGTYSQIDLTHAHLNAPATWMWAPGFETRPVEISFEPADPSWRVATQLAPTDDPYRFEAPDLQYFMDSPVELSDFDLHTWTVDEAGGSYEIRLALHHSGDEADGARFAQMAQAVVAEQIELWGDIPDFDYGTYTFLADYLAHVDGDGMEHRNSTVLTSSSSLVEADFAQLGTLSHEFIHAWNVERLRPAELEPFDFTRANATPSLWFAEGFTSYYGPLTIRRASESSVEDYAQSLGRTLNYVLNRPGRRFSGPAGMSLRAPFVDAATSIDPTNNDNIFVSYYPYGAVIGLALDLTLRRDFEGVTLDDYMRLLWAEHGVTETPYTQGDLQAGLAALTGDAAFADAFFERHVDNADLPDFAPLLEQAGLVLRSTAPGTAHAGWSLEGSDAGVVIAGNTLIGSAAYEAGLDRGDVILAIAGEPVADAEAAAAMIDAAAPGDTLTIRARRRDGEQVVSLTLGANPALELVTLEATGGTPSEAQIAFRQAWLGQ